MIQNNLAGASNKYINIQSNFIYFCVTEKKQSQTLKTKQ